METVVKCEQIKTWTDKQGKAVPIYQVHISNGQLGESFGKEIPIGTPLDNLIIEQGQYGLKIKLKQAQSNGGGFNRGSKGGNESFALAYAKDLAVAMIAAGKPVSTSGVIADAEMFYNWMQTKKQ